MGEPRPLGPFGGSRDRIKRRFKATRHLSGEGDYNPNPGTPDSETAVDLDSRGVSPL